MAAEAIKNSVAGLNRTRVAVDDTVTVLENTIASDTFSESALNAQRANIAALRASVIGTQNAAQANQAALENLDLINKQQTDALANNLRSAESQLNQANLSYDNAVVALANAKKAGEQQLTLSRTSLDGARGQYNLIADQVNDLTIKSPISGQVGGRLVDVGSEVRIGQKLAEVSETGSVKIILGLAVEDAARIKLGAKAIINDKLMGIVNQIDPAADPVSKKIKVEVVFENSKKELTAETLATVKITLVGNARLGAYFRMPLSVISIGQNENYIFTVEGERAKKVNIELIEVEGEQATIKADLPKDAKVVIEGNKLLEDGDSLAIEK
jgi:biotin carboxyl carrier protein